LIKTAGKNFDKNFVKSHKSEKYQEIIKKSIYKKTFKTKQVKNREHLGQQIVAQIIPVRMGVVQKP
jgi:dGTP triphosphohydrolase